MTSQTHLLMLMVISHEAGTGPEGPGTGPGRDQARRR